MNPLPNIDQLLKSLGKPADFTEHYAPTRLLLTKIHDFCIWKFRRKLWQTEGIQYDEAEARKLVLTYIQNPTPALKEHEEKIKAIYERLCKITKEGGGTWGDGITFSPFNPPDEKLLFHIHGGNLGASDLEGGYSDPTVKYLISYLETKGAAMSPLIETLKQALSTSEREAFYANAPKKIAQVFDEKKPLLILSGWVGKPTGHAINLEIIPGESKGKATLRFYNLGAGIEKNHPSVTQGYKEKYQPYCEWKGISREKLESPNFRHMLTEFNEYTQIPGTATNTDYGASHLYEAMREFLKPEETMTGVMPHLMMTSQTSGVCTWRSLMAFVRTRMELGDYKRFKCDIKLKSLSDFVSGHQVVDLKVWRLVRKSHQNLCRAVLELHGKKLVDDPYLEKADKILEPIAAWIKKHKNCLYTRVETPISRYTPIVQEKGLLQPLEEIRRAPLSKSQATQPHQFPMQAPVTDPKRLEEALSKIVELSNKAWVSGEDLGLHEGLIETISTLPLKEGFWKEAIQSDATKAEALIIHLGEMARFFTKSCFTVPAAHRIFPEKLYFFRKLLYLQELACRLGHPDWKIRMESWINEEVCLGPDAKMRAELREIYKNSSSGHIFTHPFEHSIQDGFNLYFDNKHYNVPDIFRQIGEKILDPKLSTHAQNAHLYASQDLPPWILAMRDATFAFQYIAKCPVGPLPKNLDRKSDLNWAFEIKENGPDASQLLVRLTGVTTALNQSPEVKRFSEKKFLAPYPEVTTAPVEKLIDLLKKNPDQFSEKWLLTTDQNCGMTREEFREVARIFTDKKMIVVETLAYFTKHPEKLQERDFQTLFHMLIFQSESFVEKDKLAQFIQRNYQQFSDQNLIQPALFLLKVAHQLHKFYPDQKFFQESTEKLKSLMQRKGVEPDLILLLMTEIIAQLGHKEKVEGDDIGFLIAASIIVEENLPHSKYPADPYALKEARRALLVHAGEIEKALREGSPNQKLLNEILLHSRGVEGKTWKLEEKPGEFPSFVTTDSIHSLYPLLSRLDSPQAEVYLPVKIRENPLFRQLFPGIQAGSPEPGNLFSFKDARGLETLVGIKEDQLIVEQKIKGEWLRFIPPASYLLKREKRLESLFGSRFLVSSYTHWQGEGKIYLMDPKSGEQKYQITGKEVTRLSDGLKLGKPSQLLQSFEDPSYIQEWYEGEGLKEIELPRFNLTFTENLSCKEFPPFTLSRASIPALGSYKEYLVLEAGNKRKVLLPRQSFKAPENKEQLLPRYELDRALALEDRDPQSFYAFDLEKGKFLPQSLEANLHLVLVLGLAQQYKSAAFYLKKYGEKTSAYTAQEAKILKEIGTLSQITGDRSGNGTALQIQADYLRIKNALSNQQKVTSNDLAGLKQLYDRYLTQYQNITKFKLRPEQEQHLLKLFGSAQNPIYLERLKKIDLGTVTRKTKRFELGDFSIPEIFADEMTEPKGRIMVTCPGIYIQNHFCSYYESARTKGAEFKKEWEALSPLFLRLQEGGRYVGMANFFEAILEKPEIFPAPLLKKDKGESAQWRKRVDELAQGQLKKPREQEVEEERPALKWPTQLFLSKESDLFTVQERKREVEGPLTLLESWKKGEDPVQQREIQRLIDDLKGVTPQTVYEVHETTISRVKELLKKEEELDQKALVQLEKEFESHANKIPETPLGPAQTRLKRGGGLLPKMTLENFMEILSERGEETLPILELFSAFLMHAIRDQKRKRAQAILEKLEAKRSPEEYKGLSHQLAQELLTQQEYNLDTGGLLYLFYEYYANLSIRPDQFAKIDEIGSGKIANPVVEMIMGSGKSKVLLPFLAFVRNLMGKEAISAIIVPTALFQSISRDTQRLLQDVFSISLRSLHFDRNTPLTKAHLEMILDDLTSVRKSGECVIMTSKSVQCLLNRFIEECAAHLKHHVEHHPKKEFPEELKIMQELVKKLRKAHPLVDEADTIFDVRHEVSFSLGNRLSPKTQELELLSELYALLYEDPNFKKLARLESDPKADPKAPVLTEQLYFETIQKPLAEAFIKKMKLPGAEDPRLLYYLLRDQAHLQSAQEFFHSQSEEIQEILAFAGEQISHLLPYTLTQVCDVKYGLDETSSDPLAIPFSASQTPSSGSQFSNSHITMNYTFQTHMKKGVSKQILESQIKLLQEKALREVTLSGRKMNVNETPSGQIFAKLRGPIDLPFFHFEPSDLEALAAHINETPALKRFFVCSMILPQMESFQQKISCNPHNLATFFDELTCFTGTPWNIMSMHHKFNLDPAKGTDAKTLSILLDATRQAPILEIQEGSISRMLEQLPKDSYQMISDAGGYFREESHTKIAKTMCGLSGKPVVFYNAKGEQTLWDGKQERPFIPNSEERLTFLDQSHTTGADVPQKWNAVNLVTIGRNMLLRDLFQSVWRLRGLDKSQRVQFVLTEEVAGIIRQKLKIDKIQIADILKFVIQNQASQQGLDNYKALKQEFENLFQTIALDLMLNDTITPQERLQAWNALSETWIKPASYSSRLLYGELRQEKMSAEVLKIDQESCRAKLKALFRKLPWLETKMALSQETLLKEMDQIVKRIEESLPARLPLPSREIDDNQTVEVESAVSTETERATQLQVEEMKETGTVRLYKVEAGELQPCPSFEVALKKLEAAPSEKPGIIKMEKTLHFPLKSYLKTDLDLRGFQDAFEGIEITLNVLEGNEAIHNLALLGSHRIDFQHLLCKDSKVILMSQKEASRYVGDEGYYNLVTGFIDPKKELAPEQRIKILKLKFLNGETEYSDEEMKELRSWLIAQDPKTMQQLFIQYILRGYPKKAARYCGSQLEKLFDELIDE